MEVKPLSWPQVEEPLPKRKPANILPVHAGKSPPGRPRRRGGGEIDLLCTWVPGVQGNPGILLGRGLTIVKVS